MSITSYTMALGREVAEFQSTVEKTMAVARQSVDLAAAAQQRVAELVAQRAAANFDELKALAA